MGGRRMEVSCTLALADLPFTFNYSVKAAHLHLLPALSLSGATVAKAQQLTYERKSVR